MPAVATDLEQPLLGLESDEAASGLQLVVEALELGDDEPPAACHAGASVQQTTFNLINVFMGIGLLSMPYAMRLSGWAGLGGLLLAATLFCISGKLIVRGFDRIPAGVPQSYSQLGKAALGKPGKILVLTFAMLEFFGASCMTLIVVWKQVETFLPDEGGLGLSPLHLSATVATAAVFPLLLIPSLRHLSHLSWLGFVSTIVVMAAVMASTAVDPHRRAAPLQARPPQSAMYSQQVAGRVWDSSMVQQATRLPCCGPACARYVACNTFGF